MLGRPGLFSRSIVQLTSSTSLQKSGDYFSTWRRTCTFWWDNAAIQYMNECLVSFVNIYIFNCSQWQSNTFTEGQPPNQRQCAADSPWDGCHQGPVLPVQLYLPWQNHVSHWWDHGKLLHSSPTVWTLRLVSSNTQHTYTHQLHFKGCFWD